MAKKDLVKIIKDNPGCVAIIDNDCWTLIKAYPKRYDQWDDDKRYDWREKNILASDDDIKSLGDGGYGSGNCCGGDILHALAIIVGIKIESV